MTFTELESPDELTEFIQAHKVCLVTFSATWCGPCEHSKPELEAMALKNHPNVVPFGYVHEHDLEDDGDFLNTFTTIFCKAAITGFPTYICFSRTGPKCSGSRVVKLEEVQEMITAHQEE
jgi:thiol-disulfide isomerase/thioredoxin